MSPQYDIAVIGSGFGGSLMAMVARRLGLSVLLLERGAHPRFGIGESSTPLSNLLLEELAETYDLPQLEPLTKWGSWQQSYPHIACGLKRGFSFFHHALDASVDARDMRDRQLLVAASPNDHIADTHWYRADLDEFLVQQAQTLGADYFDYVQLVRPVREADGWTLCGTRNGQALSWRASLLIDASGPRGFLHGVFHLGESELPDVAKTTALYAHFSGVQKFAPSACFGEAPYPVDAAAVHHVFDGGWIWVLRFNNGITSAGAAVKQCVADRLNFSAKGKAWARLLNSLPEVAQQFAGARAETPFTFAPKLAFRSAVVAGQGWALLPSAAGFVDPLLSTGFPLTLLGIMRLAAVLANDWKTPRLQAKLEAYAKATDDELLATSRLVGALYGSMGDFATFRVLSLLYFAAASYAETARRMGKPELAASFLLQDHAAFGPTSRRLLAKAGQKLNAEEKLALQAELYELIQPFDAAGLCSRPADHTYPVRAEDLLASGHKLGATREDMERVLERSGFYAGAGARAVY